jgi:hypothetical protein
MIKKNNNDKIERSFIVTERDLKSWKLLESVKTLSKAFVAVKLKNLVSHYTTEI